MKKKCRIRAITPYASLNKVIADIAGKYEDIELEIYEGDLAAGVDIAYRMRNAGTVCEIMNVELPMVTIENDYKADKTCSWPTVCMTGSMKDAPYL